MKIAAKGLLLALAHVVLLCAIGAKMLYDRTTLPHAWIKTIPVDPNMPIRGRYLRLTLAVDDPQHWSNTFVDLHVQGDQVQMGPAEFNNANYITLTTGDCSPLSTRCFLHQRQGRRPLTTPFTRPGIMGGSDHSTARAPAAHPFRDESTTEC